MSDATDPGMNKAEADRIFKNVFDAMQDAEELGGPEGRAYYDLMLRIAKEATGRAETFLNLALMQFDGDGWAHEIEPPKDGDEPVIENRFTELKITMLESGNSVVALTKAFAPQYGGGKQTFTEYAGTIHHALDVARGMVTLSQGRRTDL